MKNHVGTAALGCPAGRSPATSVQPKTTRKGAIPPAFFMCAENSCGDGARPVCDRREVFGKGKASEVAPRANKHEGFSP